MMIRVTPTQLRSHQPWPQFRQAIPGAASIETGERAQSISQGKSTRTLPCKQHSMAHSGASTRSRCPPIQHGQQIQRGSTRTPPAKCFVCHHGGRRHAPCDAVRARSSVSNVPARVSTAQNVAPWTARTCTWRGHDVNFLVRYKGMPQYSEHCAWHRAFIQSYRVWASSNSTQEITGVRRCCRKQAIALGQGRPCSSYMVSEPPRGSGSESSPNWPKAAGCAAAVCWPRNVCTHPQWT